MSRYEFLYLMVSVVVAFSAISLTLSWGAVLRRWTAVRFYWIHVAWSILILFVLLQNWWTFWQYRVVPEWSFFGMAALIINFLLLALTVAVIAPPRQFGESLDLEKLFYTISPVFFSIIAVLMVTLTLSRHFISGQPFVSADNVVRAIAISVAMLGATTRSTKVHSALVAASFGLLFVFILLQVTR